MHAHRDQFPYDINTIEPGQAIGSTDIYTFYELNTHHQNMQRKYLSNKNECKQKEIQAMGFYLSKEAIETAEKEDLCV